ncbi:MAG: carbon monoxide dehydrogenase [Paucimonas sp.]|nr:carbon monoxide dehydrogenase [Paucimonas sp.]
MANEYQAPVADGGVGARVQRKEDQRHLHGKGNFIADMSMPGLMEVAFLRSPLAHARINSITKPAAGAAQVVVRADMIDVADIVAPSTLPSYKESGQAPLAHDKVRFAGEPIAMSFARSRAEAEDLAELVEVDYDELTPVGDAFAALADTSNRVHEDWNDNIFLTLGADVGFDAQRDAPVVVKKQVKLARQVMMPMEGKAVLAYWDERLSQLVVYSGTQVPHLVRAGLSQFLGLDSGKIRVVVPDMGGAFGYKCNLCQEELCIAWLALKYRKPFRYIEDRREHLIAGANCREHHYDLTAYADNDGRLLALDAKITIDGGAYSVWPFTVALEGGQATGNLPGPYAFQGYRCQTRCVATNKPAFLPYRGVARTGVCFAMELLMDAIARRVQREPLEVRLQNLVPASAMPFKNVANKMYDSGDYQESLRRAADMIGFSRVRQRQQNAEPDGRLIGVGFATYTEQSAHGTSVFAAWGVAIVPGYEQATVRVTPSGGLEIRVGVQSHGQGMETSLAQIANEILGVPVDRVSLLHGDTAITPFSTGTYASRSAVMAGGAIATACKILRERILMIGAHLLQAAPDAARLENGAITAGESHVTLAEVAQAWYMRPERLPATVDRGGLEVTAGYKPKVDTGAFSYGSHACTVAVDPATGGVEILDYVIVEDCGQMINPMIVEGQTYGGAAQGIGTALYEEVLYDANAQPLTSTLADYLVPGATEVPNIRIAHMTSLSPHTEFGMKGMGEGGAIAPPAAIFNAVNDALRKLGVEVNQTPLTPHRLLEAIEKGRDGTQAVDAGAAATEAA